MSGWQRLNRYDIEFLPRTGDDAELCEVRRGVTKYILDRSDYDSVESAVFLDSAVGGVGWFGVRYKYDSVAGDGEAVVERLDPFSVYVDPEAHEQDFSDASYVCRAKWADKETLKGIYPEKADEIDAQFALYDDAEKESRDKPEIEPVWYSSELKKIRLVELWYKENAAFQPTVRCCVFFDRVLLEDIPSPYEHGELPFVPMVCTYYGVGDIPAGVVRDLKDPQREINKRRIQTLHILNNSANGGGWLEEDAMTPAQEEDFRRYNSVPGYYVKVRPMALTSGKIIEREPKAPPVAIIQAEAQATQDLTAISGINEALMGTDIPNGSSGRAIELKQRQAITHLAPMFDALRRAKKKLAYLLWGSRGHKGLIPEFYTAEKVYRIEGENGQQFVTVNQQIAVRDPLAGVIYKTLNDLSQGEFDVVVTDTESSATQRQAQLWSLVDAVSKLGISGDLIFDVILDLSDLPRKNDIIERFRKRQQEQAQAQMQEAQAKMRLEELKNQNLTQHIAYKDAPLPIQMAMAAKQGLVDPSFAEYVTNLWIQNQFPMYAQMQQQQQQQAQMQQLQQAAQLQQQQQPPQLPQQAQAQPKPMTDAAAKSIMAGIMPAAI